MLTSLLRGGRNPVRTQIRVLRRLLKVAAATEWGRKYNYATLARETNLIAAYQQSVPLQTRDDIASYVQRMRQGERNILWPGRICHFAVSSGTASSGTVLPLSREMMRRNLAFSLRTGLRYVGTTGNYHILKGKQLSMPGRIADDPQYPGTLVGEVSGFLLEAVPPKLRFIFSPVSETSATLPTWETKLDSIADSAISRDIRLVATVPSWALVVFNKAIQKYNREYGAAVRTVGEIWPNLQLFISAGVALSSYRAVLEELIGLPRMDFIEAYGASEGYFSYQMELDDPAMLLDLDNGLFYEFVRFDELHAPDPQRLHIGQINVDERYVMYVSTCSGLWSYQVGDIIRFTSVRPHKIVVAGRTADVLDRYGEKVFGEDIRKTLETVVTRTGASTYSYHVTSRPPSADAIAMPCLEWLVEFIDPPESLPDFATALDETLSSINRHYRIRRESGAFGCLRVIPLRQGSFVKHLQESRKVVSAQTKVLHLSEDTGTADELISLQQASA